MWPERIIDDADERERKSRSARVLIATLRAAGRNSGDFSSGGQSSWNINYNEACRLASLDTGGRERQRPISPVIGAADWPTTRATCMTGSARSRAATCPINPPYRFSARSSFPLPPGLSTGIAASAGRPPFDRFDCRVHPRAAIQGVDLQSQRAACEESVSRSSLFHFASVRLWN